MLNHNELALLSVNQAAKILSIRNENVKYLIATGKIKVIEIGKRNKIPYAELIRFVNEELKTPPNLGFSNNSIYNNLGGNKKTKKRNISYDPKAALNEILGGN